MSRIFLVSAPYEFVDEDDRQRSEVARASWDWHFANDSSIVDKPFRSTDPRPPTIIELLDFGCEGAASSDVVAYANLDVGLTRRAPALIREGVDRGLGVTVCSRRSLIDPTLGVIYDDLSAFPLDLGVDVVAMWPAWWRSVGRKKMPPMRIGYGGWDVALLLIAQMWSDRKPASEKQDRGRLLESRAHTDGVCWHKPHLSRWYVAWRAGESNALQRENIRLGNEFARAIGNPEVFEDK